MVICYSTSRKQNKVSSSFPSLGCFKCLWNKPFHVYLPLQFTKPEAQAPVAAASLLTSLHPRTPSVPVPPLPFFRARLPLASSSTPYCCPSPELGLFEPWRLGPEDRPGYSWGGPLQSLYILSNAWHRPWRHCSFISPP